jgi:SOS-response transcriptional repressor LexA
MIALEAANPAYETRVLREDQVTVQGQAWWG